MADDKPQATQQAAAQPQAGPQGQPADSATKSEEQFKQELKAGADPKEVSPPVKLNHGEKPGWLKAREEAAREATKDPWGTTPIQMRDKHDKYVDPNTEDQLPGVVLAPSGIAPEITNDALGDDSLKVQGTLPPV